MSQWTWKQTVADRLVDLVNRTGKESFTTKDVYGACENLLRKRFPRNQHVREKIRQVLQQLRDLGFLQFYGGGEYGLCLDFPEIAIESRLSHDGEEDEPVPQFRTVVQTIRLRNTLLAYDVKKRYQDACQICRETIFLVNGTYAEAHHIKPLGAPHFGQDAEGNILVVCPNHHVMLDRGALAIDPRSLRVEHCDGKYSPRQLFLAPWHNLYVTSIEYYQRNIYGKADR